MFGGTVGPWGSLPRIRLASVRWFDPCAVPSWSFLLLTVAGTVVAAAAAAQAPGGRGHRGRDQGGGRDRPAARSGTCTTSSTPAVAEHAVVVLQVDSAGTIGQDGVALGAAAGRSARAGARHGSGPVPARASGAGMLLMDAASLAAVAPARRPGRCDPVDLLHPDDVPPDLDATIDGVARGAGPHRLTSTHQDERDAGRAGAMRVRLRRRRRDVGGRPAEQGGRHDRPDGRRAWVLHTQIATTDADVQNGVGVSIRFIEPGLLVRVAHAVATPSMVYFLLVFGLACLAFEITQPGFGFAGFARACSWWRSPPTG